jgi:adenylate kinase
MGLRLVFLGPPGAGKGTQAKRVAAARGIAHVSTGDMLRSAVARGTEAGKKAKVIMEAGGLVSDDIVLEMVKERLTSDAAEGFILDGYPRTVRQAEDLEKALGEHSTALDGVVDFKLAADRAIARFAGRRSCPKCGAVYHVTANPPKQAGVCDKDGQALIHRADDQPDVIRKRFVEYDAKTAPLADHYRREGLLIDVDADGDVEDVAKRLEAALKARVPGPR